jgi:hypothetical protein
MTTKELLKELEYLAQNSGVKILRDKGNFKSGAAVLKEQKLVLINKNSTAEIAARAIARGLPDEVLQHSFIKPAVRDFIEKEARLEQPKFEIVVDY